MKVRVLLLVVFRRVIFFPAQTSIPVLAEFKGDPE